MSGKTYVPWSFESDTTSSGSMFSVYDKNGDRVSAHYCSESQAKLIAAAPELLEALRDCLALLTGNIQGPMQGIGIMKDARAAIAKATGETI